MVTCTIKNALCQSHSDLSLTLTQLTYHEGSSEWLCCSLSPERSVLNAAHLIFLMSTDRSVLPIKIHCQTHCTLTGLSIHREVCCLSTPVILINTDIGLPFYPLGPLLTRGLYGLVLAFPLPSRCRFSL